MIKIGTIKEQIKRNCDISDSKYAGLYSVCGLALRWRDLYKWEKGLAPWIEKDVAEILDWIGKKEQGWEHLAEEDYQTIHLTDETYDPSISVTGSVTLPCYNNFKTCKKSMAEFTITEDYTWRNNYPLTLPSSSDFW